MRTRHDGLGSRIFDGAFADGLDGIKRKDVIRGKRSGRAVGEREVIGDVRFQEPTFVAKATKAIVLELRAHGD